MTDKKKSKVDEKNERRQAIKSMAVSVVIDGETYSARFADVDPLTAAECRKVLGFSVRQLFQYCAEDPDLDVVAGLIWIARRQRGEKKVTYAECSEGLSWLSDFDVVPISDEDEDPDSPKASDGA